MYTVNLWTKLGEQDPVNIPEQSLRHEQGGGGIRFLRQSTFQHEPLRTIAILPEFG